MKWSCLGFRGEICGSGLRGEVTGSINLGGEVVGSGFEINESGGFAEIFLDTFNYKLCFNSLRSLTRILLHSIKIPLVYLCRIQPTPWLTKYILLVFAKIAKIVV